LGCSVVPKKRLPENRGLPERWCYKNGGYRYRVPPGLEHMWDGKKIFTLGKTLPEAYKTWTDRMQHPDKARNIADLLDRYSLQVIPTKAEKTQKENQQQIKRLRGVFGTMKLEAMTPQIVYQYFDKREAKVAAKREIALLSHAYTKAVEWGYISKHPFKGEIRLEGEKPRDRYIEDWEIKEVFKLKPLPYCKTHLAQAYIAFALVSGLRKQDILSIKTTDFTDDGIRVKTQKTGKPITIKWTPALRLVTQQLLDLRPVDISPYLMCTRRGESYYENGNSSGWDSIWKRFIDRALKETELKERFTMHDLRAKCASDIKDEADAQKLLAHSSISTTRIYRRKPELVNPAR